MSPDFAIVRSFSKQWVSRAGVVFLGLSGAALLGQTAHGAQVQATRAQLEHLMMTQEEFDSLALSRRDLESLMQLSTYEIGSIRLGNQGRPKIRVVSVEAVDPSELEGLQQERTREHRQSERPWARFFSLGQWSDLAKNWLVGSAAPQALVALGDPPGNSLPGRNGLPQNPNRGSQRGYHDQDAEREEEGLDPPGNGKNGSRGKNTDARGRNTRGPNDPVDIDQIIQVGERIYEIVKQGQPVVNLSGRVSTAAVPQGLERWEDLYSWLGPKRVTYEVVYENLWGLDVLTFKYAAIFSYGGQYKGQGKYLANLNVRPVYTSVAWGFDFDASAEIHSPVNTGTAEAPIAGLQVDVIWNLRSVISNSAVTQAHFVKGNGRESAL